MAEGALIMKNAEADIAEPLNQGMAYAWMTPEREKDESWNSRGNDKEHKDNSPEDKDVQGRGGFCKSGSVETDFKIQGCLD